MYVVLSIIAVKKYYCYILLLVILGRSSLKETNMCNLTFGVLQSVGLLFNRTDRQKVSTKHHHIFNHIFKYSFASNSFV